MKRVLAIVLTLLVCLSFVACGANSAAPKAEYDAAYEAPAEGYYGQSYAETAAAQAPGEAQTDLTQGRKLIRTVRLSAETEDYTAFMDGLKARVDQCGGYLESVDASTSGSRPSASVTIRVPANRLNEMSDAIAQSTNILHRSESQEDVTLQYVDTESRVSALRTEQERLNELLAKAETLDDILSIEDRMAEVRYQLESAESRLRVLANQVDFATIYLDVRQVEVYTPVVEEGFWEHIGHGFVASLNEVWSFLKDLFSSIIIGLPYLLLVALVVLIIILIGRKVHKKNKARREAALVRMTPAPSLARPAQEPAREQKED